MASSEKKWSKTVELRGSLHGWHERESESERHEALRRSVRDDGYATTVRRLDFIANVANRKDNERLHRVAREDLRWAERMHDEGML
jgi:hypothetical protein